MTKPQGGFFGLFRDFEQLRFVKTEHVGHNHVWKDFPFGVILHHTVI